MENTLTHTRRELCYEAWTNLRLSPMFGCICPNNHMKRRCDKIFSVVNHNPCVAKQQQHLQKCPRENFANKDFKFIKPSTSKGGKSTRTENMRP
ncbi:conserved hypothetical protein [Culex quinquefasciatus]|uniref:Uncharacterized protein n=1 Tax=Culex quinquefasciatus TaxID=7176 RepID=B0WU09_CULQU|nr:conserved hypothetical protein [Culex quinquefasciatus]|eukprot:XP_001857289.1 conserved hypothetical protein [Culex quinquefasciatus]